MSRPTFSVLVEDYLVMRRSLGFDIERIRWLLRDFVRFMGRIEHRLSVALATASERCPSLTGRRISPHTLRHTTAMHLLQSGVDITVIALWLGHEDPATTHLYIEADLTMKEAALRRVADPAPKPLRFNAPDRLLAFLEAL